MDQAPAAIPAATSAAASGIDIDALLARSYHDHAYVRRLLAPYEEGTIRALASIRSALTGGHPGKAGLAAHMLAGTLERIGAARGAELARAFKAAIDARDTAAVTRTLAALAAELVVVGRDVRAGLAACGAGSRRV